MALRKDHIYGQFTHLFRIRRFGHGHLLVALQLGESLVAAAVLLIFIRAIPLCPVNNRYLADVVALNSNMIFHLRRTGRLQPRDVTAAVFRRR